VDDATMLLIGTTVTLATGEQINYRGSYLFQNNEERRHRDRIVYAKQREFADLMLKNNHFFGSTIGPLRIVEQPYSPGEAAAVEAVGTISGTPKRAENVRGL
jgi:hypothetical protein